MACISAGPLYLPNASAPLLSQVWIPNKYLASQTHPSISFWRTQPVAEVMLNFWHYLHFSVMFALRRSFEATSEQAGKNAGINDYIFV